MATIAVAAPSNLAVCVIDNERYGEIGMQEGQTVAGVDLAAMAATAGWPITASAWTEDELEARVPVILREPGPVFAAVEVAADPARLVLPPRDGTSCAPLPPGPAGREGIQVSRPERFRC